MNIEKITLEGAIIALIILFALKMYRSKCHTHIANSCLNLDIQSESVNDNPLN